MTDWTSPMEVMRDAVAFNNFMHVLFGLYIWEFVTSLGFDWSFISGRRTLKWPLIFYFLNRYCLLFALIGIAIALNVKDRINCQALYTFNQVVGNSTVGLASINLSLRTIAVWSQKWYIVIPLIVVILGHWSLILHGVLLKAEYVDGVGCVITSTSNYILAVTFIYSMCFDFLVLFLTGWKLAFPPGGKSRLITLIFGDGLIYFMIAFLSNLLATIFMLLNLNAVMSIIANVPSAVFCTIVACRAVRRLTKYTAIGPETFGMTTQGSTLAFRTTGSSGLARPLSVRKQVHVQMDTFSATETVAQETPSESSFREYDAAGNIVTDKNRVLDIESQMISNEFKRPPY